MLKIVVGQRTNLWGVTTIEQSLARIMSEASMDNTNRCQSKFEAPQ